MIVTLKHAKNPDIAGGYWQEPVDPPKAQKVEVASLAEASQACRAYIERNGLGGGNWTGGNVTDNGKTIARVSYNGRVWAPDGTELAPMAAFSKAS